MAITLFGSVSVPTDNGTNTANPTAFANPPIASMSAGDLVIVYAYCRTASATIAVSNAGGQTWLQTTSLSASAGTLTGNLFWCIFNGTWSAAPSFSFGATTNNNVIMLVFRPTSSNHVWSLDPNMGLGIEQMASQATQTKSFGGTPINDSSVSVAFFSTDDDNTWGTLTGSGWSKTSLSAQYRNTSGQDTSATFAYNIKTARAAVADVSQTELTLGNDGGLQGFATFVEYDIRQIGDRSIQQPYFIKRSLVSTAFRINRGNVLQVANEEAANFLNSITNHDSSLRTDIDTLVTNAKKHGWWDAQIAIYPFVGSDYGSCAVNLKNPLLHKITWNGIPTFASTGVSGWSASIYGDTNINPSTHFTSGDWHMSIYSRSNIQENSDDFITTSVVGNIIGLFGLRGSVFDFTGIANGFSTSSGMWDGIGSGHFHLNVIGVGNMKGYRNGVEKTSQTPGSENLLNANIRIGSASYQGVSTKEYAFATVGKSLPPTVIGDMYTDIQAFQTSRGRQV